MPSPSSRWHRVLAVVAALTAVLTGALLCSGTSAAAVTSASEAGSGAALASAAGADSDAGADGAAAEEGPRQSTAVAPAAVVAPPTFTAPVVAAPASAVPAGEERPPGCGEGSGDGGLSPATPPRGSAPHELLPALPTTAHGAAGCSAAGDAVLDLAPERAPPAPAPGPIDLSVLRV
ncbi:hypothetical protein ACISU4_00565 [Streptomyces wuyuanensis]|uniref:hypothetical protein n=1 Tax=Streptomyces wuyuanensis TaxID=1196353 RepID=UPI00382643D1